MPSAALDLDNGPLWTMPVNTEFYLALPPAAFGLYAICLAVPTVYHDLELRAVLIANVVGMAPAFAIGVGLALAPLVGVGPPGPWLRSLTLVVAGILAGLDPHVGHFAHGAGRLTAVAYPAHRFIEQPFLDLKDRTRGQDRAAVLPFGG